MRLAPAGLRAMLEKVVAVVEADKAKAHWTTGADA
jgi:hypothetical protein